MSSLDTVRAAFAPVPGYLDAATCGLPARATIDAMRDALDTWQAGKADLAVYDEAVVASRSAFARLVRTQASNVAIGSQTSALVGTVAASVPDGAEVLVVDGDFSSVVFPFLAQADRGVTVRHAPLEQLADQIRPSTHTVAFSLVQSVDGRVADVDAITAAAAAAGARTVCDTTQAAGWLPIEADRFDVTVCAAYKWLSAPRGVAFLTVRPERLPELRPVNAGWYAGEEIWSSVYGPGMELARDARRLDVSPAWLCWVGAVPVLGAFADADPEQVRRHAVGLADGFRAGLGLEPGGSAIVALPDDAEGSRRALLAAGGTRAAGRGGGVRLAFHVWNDDADVDRALAALSNS